MHYPHVCNNVYVGMSDTFMLISIEFPNHWHDDSLFSVYYRVMLEFLYIHCIQFVDIPIPIKTVRGNQSTYVPIQHASIFNEKEHCILCAMHGVLCAGAMVIIVGIQVHMKVYR